jgi:nucleoside-triphosphatase THEP1
MSDKSTIAITVTGRPASGKSVVLKHIADHLKTMGFEVEINWGLEGEPNQFRISTTTDRVKERSKIVITEQEAPRVSVTNRNTL